MLRLTSPGVPDIYNGDELPYFALVDPDNRRPVDWLVRLPRWPARAPPARVREAARDPRGARPARPPAGGVRPSYEPLPAGEGTCAYRRGEDVVVAVPVRGDDPEVELPRGRWHNVLEGIGDALGGYRLLLLERS